MSPSALPKQTGARCPRGMRGTLLASVLSLLLGMAGTAVAHAADEPADERTIEQAIVSVQVTAQRGDWYTPWQRRQPVQLVGSGFLIGKGTVMTNAHVVSDARQILVRRNGDSTPYVAQVAHVAHDSDLALLRVEDGAFDAGVRALSLGDLPNLRTRVRTYGFPAGGERISRTEGVVSRIEFVTYVHSGADAHLAIQTDSAINPGNSGGPVMQEGRVVGVAFQANPDLNDVGFFIPTTVVKRFLRDIRDGRYDGFGDLGIVRSNLLNPAYRAYAKLPAGRTGVVVDQVLPGSSADGAVQAGDVILAIDGHPLTNDGNIQYMGHTLGYEQIAEEKQINDPVRLRLWSSGAERDVTLTVQPLAHAPRMRERFDVLPRYVVYAGLVFMELEQEYLNIFGNYWENATQRLLYAHFFRHAEAPETVRETPIVLTRILPHAVNRAYLGLVNSLVSEINGKAITALEDIPPAFAAATGDYHLIRLERGGSQLILERAAAAQAQDEILQQYGVREAKRLE